MAALFLGFLLDTLQTCRLLEVGLAVVVGVLELAKVEVVSTWRLSLPLLVCLAWLPVDVGVFVPAHLVVFD